MSEEIKGKNTTPETEVNQNTPEVEDKAELIASDSLDKMMEELKEEADGKPQSDLQEAEKTGSTASVENVKKYKLFFVSDMDEEAEYLHSMSEKGLHFVSKNGIQYIFKKDAPRIIITLGIMKKIFAIRISMWKITKRQDGKTSIMKRGNLMVSGITSVRR